jgi:hypothetical protein
VTIAACVPYLTLKIAWLCGSHAGIPAGSALRDAGRTVFAGNLLTVLMDGAVVLLAFALTRPWGRRLPAALVLLPLWVATGLLAPIVLGAPAVALAGAFGAETGTPPGDDEAFLAPWVFALVYGGFGVQALALGGLVAVYVRDRWGGLLRRRLAGPAAGGSRRQRAAALVAAVAAVGLAVPRVLWLCGATAGLSDARIAERDAAFHVAAATDVLFAVTAAAGVLLLVRRPARWARLRTGAAVVPAWTGGAALAAGGGWLLVTGAATGSEHLNAVMALLYAGQVMTGGLILAAGARHLAARAAVAP